MEQMNHYMQDNMLSQDDENKTRGLTGLKNLGNTCFMNAALQALSNCPPLTRFMVGEGWRSSRGELTRSYAKLMREMWSHDGPSIVTPNGILHGIRGVCSIFRDRRQQDAQEFLRYLLDQMHEELKQPSNDADSSSEDESPKTNGVDSYDDEYETCDSGLSSEMSGFGDENRDSTVGDEKWNNLLMPLIVDASPDTNVALQKALAMYKQKMQKKELRVRELKKKKRKVRYRSIITDLFDGKIISSVECLTCGNLSTTKENFQDLSLPIPNKDHLQLLRVTGAQSLKDADSSNKVGTPSHETSSSSSPNKSNSPHNNNNLIRQESKKEPRRTVNWRLATLIPLYAGFGLITRAITSIPAVYHLFWSWLDWVLNWILGPPITLQDCLQAFFSLDELKGDDMYNCDKCKKLRNGVKLSRVSSLPNILCIHLKRFRHDLPYPQKITRHVSFPLNNLNMSPYMSPTRRRSAATSVSSKSEKNVCIQDNDSINTNESNHSNSSSLSSSSSCPSTSESLHSNQLSEYCDDHCSYDLLAAICHTGTHACGHYITYALNDYNQTWYEFDDQYVTPVDPETIASSEAYVLFYRKISNKK